MAAQQPPQHLEKEADAQAAVNPDAVIEIQDAIVSLRPLSGPQLILGIT